MKCLYYLAPTLDSTRTITDDLHAIGIADWYLHVVSKNEAGLKREKIHSSNYVETLDILRTGLIGAYVGFFIGIFAAIALMATNAFGQNASLWAYPAVILTTTLFGGWFGGLIGVGTENHKLSQFHMDLESGQYLFLIYTREGKLDAVQEMMRQRHRESLHVATDTHFLNPLGHVDRMPHAR